MYRRGQQVRPCRVEGKLHIQAACCRHVHPGKLFQHPGFAHIQIRQLGHHLNRLAVVGVAVRVEHIQIRPAPQIQFGFIFRHRIHRKRERPHAPRRNLAAAAVGIHIGIITHEAKQLPRAAPIHHLRLKRAFQILLHQRINRAADVVVHQVGGKRLHRHAAETVLAQEENIRAHPRMAVGERRTNRHSRNQLVVFRVGVNLPNLRRILEEHHQIALIFPQGHRLIVHTLLQSHR